MPTVSELADSIDALLEAPKRVLGADQHPEWQTGLFDDELQLKLPLEVRGELLGAKLLIVGRPAERRLWFRLGILFPGMVCRIDHTEEAHSNPLLIPLGIPRIVVGPHYHPWSLNRANFKGFTKAARLTVAIPYEPNGRTFDANLRWFCKETNIESLQAGHRIELPRSDKLL